MAALARLDHADRYLRAVGADIGIALRPVPPTLETETTRTTTTTTN